MKTKKQVIAMFEKLRSQIVTKDFCGIVDVSLYTDPTGHWSVKITRAVFNEGYLEEYDYCEWSHFSFQKKEDEAKNLEKIQAFKDKFNLK